MPVASSHMWASFDMGIGVVEAGGIHESNRITNCTGWYSSCTLAGLALARDMYLML